MSRRRKRWNVRQLAAGLALIAAGAGLGFALYLALEPLGLSELLAPEAAEAAEAAEGTQALRRRADGAAPSEPAPDPFSAENAPGLIALACGVWVSLRLVLAGLATLLDAREVVLRGR